MSNKPKAVTAYVIHHGTVAERVEIPKGLELGRSYSGEQISTNQAANPFDVDGLLKLRGGWEGDDA